MSADLENHGQTSGTYRRGNVNQECRRTVPQTLFRERRADHALQRGLAPEPADREDEDREVHEHRCRGSVGVGAKVVIKD